MIHIKVKWALHEALPHLPESWRKEDEDYHLEGHYILYILQMANVI